MCPEDGLSKFPYNTGDHLLGAKAQNTTTRKNYVKVAVFCVVAPNSLVENYRRFRNTCCFHDALIWAVSTSETSIRLYQTTWGKNSKDSHHYLRAPEP
jgi:hypothetical protein